MLGLNFSITSIHTIINTLQDLSGPISPPANALVDQNGEFLVDQNGEFLI